MPVLELDDGSHIAESVAICRYFEALHPEPPLFGTTPKAQALVEMWSRRVELNGMRPIGMVWIHGSPLTKAVNPHQIPEVAEQNRGLVHQFWAFLDRSLEGREWLAGDAYTIADILALTTVDFASRFVEVPPDPGLASLAAWHARASARPSATA